MDSSSFQFLSKLGLKPDPEEASFAFFAVVLVVCYIIVRIFEKKRWLNESVTSLAIGICTGISILLITGGKSSHLLEFNEQFFFIYILPPIIFNAGYQVKKKKLFFRNFPSIILFGAFGSVISFLIISLGSLNLFKKLGIGSLSTQDYFALGAILTATDSVCTLQVLKEDETPLLYSLVFGEGVINDATSVVLFNAIKKFDLAHITSANTFQLSGSFLSLFFESILLGIAVGLLCSFIVKKLSFGRHPSDYEAVLMILLAYISYLIAELYLLSGILSVFFCGIVMSHYTSWQYNESDSSSTPASRQAPRHVFATISFVAEIIIFLYVGMDALDIGKWKVVKDSPGTSFAASSILLCLVLVGRAAFVFPLSFLSNLTRSQRKDHIGFKQQFTIWWAGLMRGAVSVALAYHQFAKPGENEREASMMITSTITIVLFTNVVCGLFTKSIVKRTVDGNGNNSDEIGLLLQELNDPLLVVDSDDAENKTDEETNYDISFMSLLMTSPIRCFQYYWMEFDNCIMRPIFGRTQSSTEVLPPISSP